MTDILTFPPERIMGIRDLAMVNAVGQYPIQKKEEYRLATVHKYLFPHQPKRNTDLLKKQPPQSQRHLLRNIASLEG